MDLQTKPNLVLVTGASGTGKSTFALRYLVNAPLGVRFMFDPAGEFAERLRAAPARTAGELDLALVRGWVVFDPHTLFAGRMDDAFAFFCEWVFAVSERIPGPKALVVDEVWKYCSPQVIPPELAMVAQTGRKASLALMVLTQQPQRLNGSILNEVTEAVSFRLQFPRALELMAQYGYRPEELQSLPDLAWVAVNRLSGGELRGRIEP
jgi:hypothetical protein